MIILSLCFAMIMTGIFKLLSKQMTEKTTIKQTAIVFVVMFILSIGVSIYNGLEF
jgi:hypothetical protein